MTEDEKYVREKWQQADEVSKGSDAGIWLHMTSEWESCVRIHKCVDWSAAAEFTRTRLEQIREVEEEIEWIQDCIEMSGIFEPEKGIPEQRRILAREQAALADLRRGMK